MREAEGGRDGIAEFQRQLAALVISDIVTPDVEGIETIRTLRREQPDIPIIAVSGGGDPIYRHVAGKLGAAATLEKPFSPAQLLALVEGVLAG